MAVSSLEHSTKNNSTHFASKYQHASVFLQVLALLSSQKCSSWALLQASFPGHLGFHTKKTPYIFCKTQYNSEGQPKHGASSLAGQCMWQSQSPTGICEKKHVRQVYGSRKGRDLLLTSPKRVLSTHIGQRGEFSNIYGHKIGNLIAKQDLSCKQCACTA